MKIFQAVKMIDPLISNSKSILILVIVAFIYLHESKAFNLSPKPNLVLHEPIAKVNTGMPKMRSSYFGFSINLKRNSIFIGAPRAQSTIELQRRINETGAIYKCNFNQKFDDNVICDPFIFDEWANVDNTANQYTYDNEKKDYRWLGATMDSNANDYDKFVVCAPRLVSNVNNHYLMHGVCYWTTNTSMHGPNDVQKITPLRLKDKQQRVIDNATYFYYMFGEQGISVHITENNEEILVGAPGIFTWKGSVVRHKAKPLADFGGLSRRNENPQSIQRQKYSQGSVEYSSDVPNPLLWNQDDNSYFGFAISSSYFDGPMKTKLLYVASAPQANEQQGEVYIFDIVDHFSADKTIKIYYKFSGQSFGEYFGYSLLTEDFNNDGFTDIAIGAPYHSRSGSYENGAVYIYKNEGTSSNFALHTVLYTDYEFSGRFGTTMTKIGDINNDGYNDLIVAAPFEGNGAIYIYHGSANGLSVKASQKIMAPSSVSSLNQMFGHGLSKGVDIDDNQYLDIAVGSPNTDTVYIYRSYPIIRAITSITPESQEIQATDTSIKFKVCWMYESTHPLNFDVDFNATIKLDAQLKRASFNDGQNEYIIYDKITTQEKCEQFTANVCVAVNPNEAKSIKNKIVFSTGCETARCVADLKLTSSKEQIPRPYILGSSTSLAINYNIENNGETAYLAQIKITLPNSEITFTKIPSNCKLDELNQTHNTMECDLNDGRPMNRGEKTSLKIGIETEKLDGEELIVKAQVFSTGDKLNEIDNKVEDIIALGEFSDVEIFGKSTDNQLTFNETDKFKNVTYTFEIRNNGPSNIKLLEIIISLPISYANPVTLKRENLIDTNSVSMKATYDNQQYDAEWTQNNKILILDAIESTSSIVPIEDYNGIQFDASKIGQEYDLNGGNPNVEELSGARKRRSESSGDDVYYNQYLQKVVETTEYQYSFPKRYKRDIFSSNDQLLANLPVNRTTYFDCQDPAQDQCLQGKIIVSNFRVTDVVNAITLNFTIDMDEVSNVLAEKHDILVIRALTDIARIPDEHRDTLKIVQSEPFTIISKYKISSTPLWVYILSIIVGILSMILISYAMHRFGFFRRNKRDELVKLKRQSEAMSYYPNEDEDQF